MPYKKDEVKKQTFKKKVFFKFFSKKYVKSFLKLLFLITNSIKTILELFRIVFVSIFAIFHVSRKSGPAMILQNRPGPALAPANSARPGPVRAGPNFGHVCFC